MMNKLMIHYLEGDLIVALFFCIRNTYIKYFIRIIFCHKLDMRGIRVTLTKC